jgi:hypothetical protein
MSVKKFDSPSDEQEYRAWLNNATDGYVANRWRDGTTVVLHRRNCWTLTANRYCHTTALYPKLCGRDLQELQKRMRKEWPEKEKACSFCLP